MVYNMAIFGYYFVPAKTDAQKWCIFFVMMLHLNKKNNFESCNVKF